MTSEDRPVISARKQLLLWGALMAAIYLVYLYFFPLFPLIESSKSVLDIEMILKHGQKWFAPLYALGLGVLFYAYWRMLKIVHAISKEQAEAARSLRYWVLGIGIVCALLLLWLLAAQVRGLWARLRGQPMPARPDLRRWQTWARQAARTRSGASSGVIDVEARELR